MAAARTGWKTGKPLEEKPAGLAPSRSSRLKSSANEKAADHVRFLRLSSQGFWRASKPDRAFFARCGSISIGHLRVGRTRVARLLAAQGRTLLGDLTESN